MKFFTAFLFSFLLLIFATSKALAVNDPLSVTNNKYGIHIENSADLKDAAALVNSSGGDWGYFTIVIQQTQRDTLAWQKVFDEARRLHLIPIIRVATRPLGNVWEKPSLGEIDGWVSFLNSLNWVVKNRYVVIGNEPNHAREWGGELAPEEYATYLDEFTNKLKVASDDFFVLPAGFDASSANSKESMDEVTFLRRMLSANPALFDRVDGWASHSYPNPDFSGPENGFGRGSVRTFQWELSLLEGFGVSKKLPVFITETGWVHDTEDVSSTGKKLSFAYEHVWREENIVAVTPFILSYGNPPFDVFSWKSKGGYFYSFYSDVQALTKEKGTPVQIDRGSLQSIFVQPFHLTESSFTGIAFVRNEGQAIWSKNELSLWAKTGEPYEISGQSFEELEPGATGFVIFRGITPASSGIQTSSAVIKRNGEAISSPASFQLVTISPARMKLDSFFATILRLFKGL